MTICRAIGAESRTLHTANVAGKWLTDRLAGRRVPHPSGLIRRRSDDKPAVGAELCRVYSPVMALERLTDRLAGRGVPTTALSRPEMRLRSVLPSGLNAALHTTSLWPLRGFPTAWPVAESQMRAVLSKDAQ